MKNKSGFVPKSLMQPVKYEFIFNNWCATYIHPLTGVEYQVELESRTAAGRPDEACRAFVLWRNAEKSRREYAALEGFSSIRKAVKWLESKFAADSREEVMRKYRTPGNPELLDAKARSFIATNRAEINKAFDISLGLEDCFRNGLLDVIEIYGSKAEIIDTLCMTDEEFEDCVKNDTVAKIADKWLFFAEVNWPLPEMES